MWAIHWIYLGPCNTDQYNQVFLLSHFSVGSILGMGLPVLPWILSEGLAVRNKHRASVWAKGAWRFGSFWHPKKALDPLKLGNSTEKWSTLEYIFTLLTSKMEKTRCLFQEFGVWRCDPVTQLTALGDSGDVSTPPESLIWLVVTRVFCFQIFQNFHHM